MAFPPERFNSADRPSSIRKNPQLSSSIDVFNLVPALIDVHDEQHEWARLSRTIHMLEGTVTGLGIPTGGGIVAHPDGTLEALRRPVDEFSWDGTRIKQSILLPA